MQEGVHFVGAGDGGNRTAIELSRIYDGLRDGLFYEGHDEPQNHLHIHSFPFAETPSFNADCNFIILAGSVHDPCWEEARMTLYENRPYFMLTIGIDAKREINYSAFQPFGSECLVFPDPSLFDPIEIAELVMQIIFIHEPWQSNMCTIGSLIGYDLADTKELFSGKITKVLKVKSDKDQYRQNFSRFLSKNRVDLGRAISILISFWGRDDVLSIPKVNELWEEMKRLTMPEADLAFTFHILPEGETAFMAILFLTTTQSV